MTSIPTRAIRRRSLLGGSAALAAATSLATNAEAATHRTVKRATLPFSDPSVVDGGVRLMQGDTVIDIVSKAEGTLSVVKYPKEAKLDTAGFFLGTDRPAQTLRLDGAHIRSGDIEVRIGAKAGALAVFYRGRLVLSDTGTLPVTSFALSEASDLYGFGQFRDALPNYRDRTVYLAQANMDSVNPVVVSPHGYGILWDTHTDSHFANAGKTMSFSNTAPLTRYHLMFGADIDGVIAGYRRLTGTAPLLGKYAYGFWQSQERYHSQDEVTGIVDGYRSRSLPLDVVVQDWRYWGDDARFSGMVWDAASYPDPRAMCDHVHAANAHIIASVWPAFGPASQVYKDLDAQGLLFKGAHWGGGKVLDITAPRARDIYWSHIDQGLLSVGLDGLWTDGCEPEFLSTGSRYVTALSYAANGDCAAGPIRDNLLTFSYYQTRLIHEGMRRSHPARRPLTLSRKVYAGQQAFNAVTWSGDQFAGWDTLNYQIVAAQQFSLTGVPYWTDDIGGFLVSHRFLGGLDNPAWRELYVRWFQFGAFMPVFRAHGTEVRRELWAFGGDGDPAYDAQKAALQRRYALMPYIYSQAANVTLKHETFLRPLVMDFAHDPRVADFPNQYLFGRDILVAVVNTPLEHTPANLYEFIPNYAVTGLAGPAPEVSFYEGAHFDRLVETRLSDDLKMSWTGDLPFALKGKPYSARWKGRIIAQESGLHDFSIITQGLISFAVDGKTRIASAGTDEGKANGANGGVSFAGHAGDDSYHFQMELVAGRAYAFELKQSQPTPDVVSLWVEWSRPSVRAARQAHPDKTLPVWLPAGHDWYLLDNPVEKPVDNPGIKPGKIAGGQVLRLRPALHDMPVFARAGAIIPQTPGIQYAAQPVDRIDLHVYSGADGAFTLYDDAGDGHAYETGERRLWPLSWSDKSRTLRFEAAQGTYAGAVDRIAFAIIVHEADGRLTQRTVTVAAAQPHSETL